MERKKKKLLKSKVFLNSLLFTLGFLVVFVVLGIMAQSAGRFLNTYGRPIQIVGGLLFILLGMHLAGIFSLNIFRKQVQFKINNHLTKYQYVNSFLVGLIFGFGWTPCIGPVLAVILFWASQSGTFWKGFWLLLSFGLGLAIPFLILSLFTEKLMRYLRKMQKGFRIAQIVAGLLVIIIGILLIGNWLGYLVAPLVQYGTLETILSR
ncbi:MAG: sulfite exporter TauE/SafE family protein [Planctomycetes bacterium]|nr:sulfite exporter TauE/SafE family protein [Planctomycetota bacterium]